METSYTRHPGDAVTHAPQSQKSVINQIFNTKTPRRRRAPDTKKAGVKRRPLRWSSESCVVSVARGHGGAESVVHPHRRHVDILLDGIEAGVHGRGRREADVARSHEQVIVLDRD